MRKEDAMNLEMYLRCLPRYKKGDGMSECRYCCAESVLLNATVYLDYAYDPIHQGDITIDTLKGIRKRIGYHVVFIFWECNRRHLPFERPYGQEATTEEEKAAFRWADLILVGDRATINIQDVLKEKIQEVGFKNIIERNYWQELTDDFHVKPEARPVKDAEFKKNGCTGLGALFG
jgi:hypothetical protein